MTRPRTMPKKRRRQKPKVRRPSRVKPQKRRARPKPRATRPVPVMSEVIGLRCRVKEVLLLDETLILIDDVLGKQFALPLPVLLGRDTLEHIEQGQAVWLSVRVERRAGSAS